MSFAVEGILGLVITLIVFAISLGIYYFIIKTAVAVGIRDSMWNLEISIRNAVKAGVLEATKEREQMNQVQIQNAVKLGVQEALQEIENNKAGGNNG